MSEATTEQTAPVVAKPAEHPLTKPQGDPAAETLGEGGKKALQAERDRAKELEKQLSAATARLGEIERANESALEKAQREAKEAQLSATAAIAEALRFRIAAETGINDNVDLILTAGDEETMRRQAQLWMERTPTTVAAGPRPDLTQGGSGTTPALNSDGLEQALKAKLGIT